QPAALLQSGGDEHGPRHGGGDARRAAAARAVRLPAAVLRGFDRGDGAQGMSAILALDLGGTRLRAGLAAGGEPASVTTLGKWEAPQGREGFRAIVGRLVTGHRGERLGRSIPGLAGGTTCVWVPNLPWLEGVDVAALFRNLVV